MKSTIEKIIDFSHERDWDLFHSEENLAKSICIEAGELLECFQWNSEYNKQDVCDELADIMNYCILLANKLNVNMDTILLEKLDKNDLKYPVDKAKGNSKKYTKL